MTDAELKELVASLAIEHKTFQAEQKASREEFDQQMRELGKQIGGLGKKFGSFTEGLALPSMTQILRDRFKMETISPSVRISKLGEELEVDVLAWANSSINEAYVVEVKSHLREEGIEQLADIVTRFRQFFPEHRDKRVYGILAAVEMSKALHKKVLEHGFYAARINDEVPSRCPGQV